MLDNLRIYFFSAFEHSEHRRFPRSAATSFPSDSSSTEVTFIEFHFSVLERTLRFAKFGNTRANCSVKFVNRWARNVRQFCRFLSLDIETKIANDCSRFPMQKYA